MIALINLSNTENVLRFVRQLASKDWVLVQRESMQKKERNMQHASAFVKPHFLFAFTNVSSNVTSDTIVALAVESVRRCSCGGLGPQRPGIYMSGVSCTYF